MENKYVLVLFCIVLVLGHILLSSQVPKKTEKGILPTKSEIETFRRNLKIAICSPQLLYGLIVIFSGKPTLAFTTEKPDWSNIFVISYWILNFLTWFLIIWWLWVKDGANYLARFTPAFNLNVNANVIRWFLTGIVGISIISAITLF